MPVFVAGFEPTKLSERSGASREGRASRSELKRAAGRNRPEGPARLPGPVAQVLSGLGEDPLFLEATALTAVNDSALIASREARSASR